MFTTDVCVVYLTLKRAKVVPLGIKKSPVGREHHAIVLVLITTITITLFVSPN